MEWFCRQLGREAFVAFLGVQMMKKFRWLLAVGAMLVLAEAASAEMLPSFYLESSAWKASDIVVAVKEGKSARVLETWKGNLEPGAVIQVHVPELPAELPGWADMAGRAVTGKRVVLFLRHAPKDAKPS